MKKLITFSFLLFITMTFCFASNSWMDVQYNYYTGLLTCAPNKFEFKGYIPFAKGIIDDKVWMETTFQIYGKKNGFCKFRETDTYEDTECEVPIHLAKAYGEKMLSVMKMTEPSENDDISMLLSWVLEGKYCKSYERR